MGRRTKWAKGKFTPKHPEKYIGTYPIIYRSSWELVFMNKCDTHPSIQQWASESIKIPYYNPFKRTTTIYKPDFLIHYVDRVGKSIVEIIEIKPSNQAIEGKAKGRSNQFALALNKIKWAAATIWAKKHGMQFRVMNETNMWATKSSNRKRKKG